MEIQWKTRSSFNGGTSSVPNQLSLEVPNNHGAVHSWEKDGRRVCKECADYTSGYRCPNRTDLLPLPAFRNRNIPKPRGRITVPIEQTMAYATTEEWDDVCAYYDDYDYPDYSYACVTNESAIHSRHDKWLVDSGCSDHITPYLSDFSHISNGIRQCKTASGDYMNLQGPGTVIIKHQNDKGSRTLVLTGVYYASKADHRLLSVIQLTRQGFRCVVTDKTQIWDSKGRLVITAKPLTNQSSLHWFTSELMTPTVDAHSLQDDSYQL